MPSGTESRYGTPLNSSAPSPLRPSFEGATTPKALPVTVNALTRNSGWAHDIATLLLLETLSTTPISPSGDTTGLNTDTPCLAPALSSRVRPSMACG